MKKLHLFFCISLFLPMQATRLPQKVLRTLTNGLFYLIASSDASEKTTAQTQDLLKKIDPSKKLLAVRTFNRFGKFLFGEHNTITIPYLNYVIIDNEGMENLSEEARTFALGRCIMTLRHQNKYLTYTYVIPFVMQQIYKKATTEDERNSLKKFLKASTDMYKTTLSILKEEDPTVSSQKELLNEQIDATYAAGSDALYPVITACTLYSFSGYCKRGIVHELDARARTLCASNKGALEYFKQLEQSSAKSLWGHFAFICSGLLAQHLGKSQEGKPSLIKKCLTTWAQFIHLTKKSYYYLPGRNSTFHWLPFFGHFDGGQPSPQSRIDALENKNDIKPQNILRSLIC